MFLQRTVSFSVLGFDSKKVNPQGMKTSPFSQLKKTPPVTEENIIFFFFNYKKSGFQSKMVKRYFFFLFSFIYTSSSGSLHGPTAHASCQASSQLELPLWALVPWGATFHPEPSAERCKGCHGAIPAEFQLLEKLHEWPHFLYFAD